MTAPKQHKELGWVMGPGSVCRICGKDYLHTHTHQEVVAAVANPAPASASEPAVTRFQCSGMASPACTQCHGNMVACDRFYNGDQL